MARRPKKPKKVESLVHDEASRKNIPTAELQSLAQRMEEMDPTQPVTYGRQNPLAEGEVRQRNADLDPQIVWKGATLRLTPEMMEQLSQTGRLEIGDAQLVWRGKDQQDWSDLVVQAPPLYIQEKIHPKAIIEDLKKQTKQRQDADKESPDMFDLFGDFNGLDAEAKTEFYAHDQHWQNRMILGDSLQVMASLAERESLRGKVQCIYFDPPYGIKFNSNWQVSTRSRDVKDGKLDQITREPEQVKAFRDTWKDGIHSYLTYLRDRMTAMRDLLTESGSIFVQIGDENVHRVRALMDEVFGEENFVSEIILKKGGTKTARHLSSTTDFILFYAKDISNLKYREIFSIKKLGIGDSTGKRYDQVQFPDQSWRALIKNEKENPNIIPQHGRVFKQSNPCSQHDNINHRINPLTFEGKEYFPSKDRQWSSNLNNMQRLIKADRIISTGKNLTFKMFMDDYPLMPINNIWQDLLMRSERMYVVETASSVIQRCILMATDPGDLVLDPTCGSGTTATVAEQWGRRWITLDTSRVSLALARARLMGARYPYYFLADSVEGRAKEQEITGKIQPDTPTHGDIRQGFVYQRAPHIMLKTIANNAEIDVIWDNYQEKLEPLRESLNAALGRSGRQQTHPDPPLSGREQQAQRPPDKGDTGGLSGEQQAQRPPDKGDTGGLSGPDSEAGPDSGGFLPYDPALKDKARELRKNMTPAERKLWYDVLSNRQLAGLKFLRQKPLDHYIVDFYCAELMLAIEIDGDSHADQQTYDAARSERLAQFGIRVIRYSNHDVMDNLAGIYQDLHKQIEKRKTNPPRPSLVREGVGRTERGITHPGPPSSGREQAQRPPDKGDTGGLSGGQQTHPGPPLSGREQAQRPPDKGDTGGLSPLEEWEIPREANEDWPAPAKDSLRLWWELRIARQKEIDKSIAQKADVEMLYDRPYEDTSKVRVAGPFTVESLSPHRVIPADEEELSDLLDTGERVRKDVPLNDFTSMVLENLKSAGVHQAAKDDKIKFMTIDGWPGNYIAAEGRYMEGEVEKRSAIFIGPEFGTVTRADLTAAAREALDGRFDALIACGFNFDAHTSELSKLGPLPILKAKMNPDLHMSDELKNTGQGNLFVVFGEPDIEWKFDEDGNIIVEVLGIDVFDPKTGEVRASGKDDIAAWFIDTDYNEESFFVRHAYFLGANDPYKSLKTSLKAEIDREAWQTLYRDKSRPFARPETGRFAVKVINHFGDEVMKIFGV